MGRRLRTGMAAGQVLALVVILTVFAITSAAQGNQALPSVSVSTMKAQLKTPFGLIHPSDRAASARAAAAAPAVLAPGTPGPDHQVSRIQTLDEFRVGASETTITSVGTLADGKLVVGWNDAEGFGFAPFSPGPPLGLSGFGYSTNGGTTWKDGGAPPIGSVVAFGPGTMGHSATGQYETRGDPWLATGGLDGMTVFYANLGVWTDDAGDPPAGVTLHKGAFTLGGFGWTAGSTRLIQSPNYPNDFLDKEAMAVKGNTVHITLTNFIEVCDIPFFGFGQIELYRSTNGGKSWNRGIIQPDESFITDPSNPACGQDGVVDQGSAPAIGPAGQLYVVWERGWFAPLAGGSETPRATIAFRGSTDKGVTWGPRMTLRSICSIALNPARSDFDGGPSGYNRTSINDFPRIAVDRSSGPFRGSIYVAFQDCSARYGPAAPFGDDSDVYIMYSRNGGMTWSAPVPVQAKTADTRWQFFPVPTVDSRGTVRVAYYDVQDINFTPDPTDDECQVRVGGTVASPVLKKSKTTSFADVMVTQSTNGGVTWSPPVAMNSKTTNWCASTPLTSIRPNYGDYIDARGQGTRVHVVWGDGRNGGFRDRVPTTWYGSSR